MHYRGNVVVFVDIQLSHAWVGKNKFVLQFSISLLDFGKFFHGLATQFRLLLSALLTFPLLLLSLLLTFPLLERVFMLNLFARER